MDMIRGKICNNGWKNYNNLECFHRSLIANWLEDQEGKLKLKPIPDKNLNFEIVGDPNSSIEICFYYIPEAAILEVHDVSSQPVYSRVLSVFDMLKEVVLERTGLQCESIPVSEFVLNRDGAMEQNPESFSERLKRADLQNLFTHHMNDPGYGLTIEEGRKACKEIVTCLNLLNQTRGAEPERTQQTSFATACESTQVSNSNKVGKVELPEGAKVGMSHKATPKSKADRTLNNGEDMLNKKVTNPLTKPKNNQELIEGENSAAYYKKQVADEAKEKEDLKTENEDLKKEKKSLEVRLIEVENKLQEVFGAAAINTREFSKVKTENKRLKCEIRTEKDAKYRLKKKLEAAEKEKHDILHDYGKLLVENDMLVKKAKFKGTFQPPQRNLASVSTQTTVDPVPDAGITAENGQLENDVQENDDEAAIPEEETDGRNEVSLSNQPDTPVEEMIYVNYKRCLTICSFMMTHDGATFKVWAAQRFPVNPNLGLLEIFEQLDEIGVISAANLDLLKGYFTRINRFDLVFTLEKFLAGDYNYLRSIDLTRFVGVPHGQPPGVHFYPAGKNISTYKRVGKDGAKPK